MNRTRHAIAITAILVASAVALTVTLDVVPALVGGIAAAVGLAFTALVVLADRPLPMQPSARHEQSELAGTAALYDAQRALVG